MLIEDETLVKENEKLQNDNPIMILLMIVFSFVVVVYLMNLFIGLLNIAIKADNDRAFYLAQKAEVSKKLSLI